MVASQPLGPGKFYGSSLPRPYIYKNNSDRINPPVSLMDPLLSWARDAHWSMGGLSYTRLRLQGRIEGNIKRLRAQCEKQVQNHTPTAAAKMQSKASPKAPFVMKRKRFTVLVDEDEEEEVETVGKGRERKRLSRRLREDFDDEEEVEMETVGKGRERRKLARRLREDFDEVADKSPEKGSEKVVRVSPRLARRLREDFDEVAEKSPEKGSEKSPEKSLSGVRVSPRLVKRGLGA